MLFGSILGAVGAGIGFFGQRKAAKAQQRTAQYQAQYQNLIGGYNADNILAISEFNASQGEQLAAYNVALANQTAEFNAGSAISFAAFNAQQQTQAADANNAIERAFLGFDLQAQLDAIKLEEVASEMRYSEAKINHQMQMLDVAFRAENAANLRQLGEVRTDASREQINRQRLALKRQHESYRARIGASGIVEEGSPMEMLAQSAADSALVLGEMQREANYQRDEIFNQATMADMEATTLGYQASQRLGAATFARDAGAVQLAVSGNQAQSRYQTAVTQSDLNRTFTHQMAAGELWQATTQAQGHRFHTQQAGLVSLLQARSESAITRASGAISAANEITGAQSSGFATTATASLNAQNMRLNATASLLSGVGTWLSNNSTRNYLKS